MLDFWVYLLESFLSITNRSLKSTLINFGQSRINKIRLTENPILRKIIVLNCLHKRLNHLSFVYFKNNSIESIPIKKLIKHDYSFHVYMNGIYFSIGTETTCRIWVIIWGHLSNVISPSSYSNKYYFHVLSYQRHFNLKMIHLLTKKPRCK